MTGDISVNMGKVTDEMEEVSVLQNAHTWNALNISVGNPHAVTFVEDLEHVGSLVDAPVVNPASSYPEGVNVEFVQILPNNEAKMRVHERGSGETRSCGTGTCAVALAATIHTGGKLPSRWTIYPPGGRLIVDLDGHSNATLIGPAELVRDVEIGQYLNS
jgi:diaminopimelate epimerase